MGGGSGNIYMGRVGGDGDGRGMRKGAQAMSFCMHGILTLHNNACAGGVEVRISHPSLLKLDSRSPNSSRSP